VCDVAYATSFMSNGVHTITVWLIVTNVPRVCLSVCVCLLDTTVSPTKTAGPIEVLFGLRTRVGPLNRVLCGGLDPPMGKLEIPGHLQADCEV